MKSNYQKQLKSSKFPVICCANGLSGKSLLKNFSDNIIWEDQITGQIKVCKAFWVLFLRTSEPNQQTLFCSTEIKSWIAIANNPLFENKIFKMHTSYALKVTLASISYCPTSYEKHAARVLRLILKAFLSKEPNFLKACLWGPFSCWFPTMFSVVRLRSWRWLYPITGRRSEFWLIRGWSPIQFLTPP